MKCFLVSNLFIINHNHFPRVKFQWFSAKTFLSQKRRRHSWRWDELLSLAFMIMIAISTLASLKWWSSCDGYNPITEWILQYCKRKAGCSSSSHPPPECFLPCIRIKRETPHSTSTIHIHSLSYCWAKRALAMSRKKYCSNIFRQWLLELWNIVFYGEYDGGIQ